MTLESLNVGERCPIRLALPYRYAFGHSPAEDSQDESERGSAIAGRRLTRHTQYCAGGGSAEECDSCDSGVRPVVTLSAFLEETLVCRWVCDSHDSEVVSGSSLASRCRCTVFFFDDKFLSIVYHPWWLSRRVWPRQTDDIHKSERENTTDKLLEYGSLQPF